VSFGGSGVKEIPGAQVIRQDGRARGHSCPQQLPKTGQLGFPVSEAYHLRPFCVASEITDFDISEPNVASVILEQDVAFDPVPETRSVLKFALCNDRLERLRTTLVLEHLYPVQPMLDMLTAD
jgi:hypothetical protein